MRKRVLKKLPSAKDFHSNSKLCPNKKGKLLKQIFGNFKKDLKPLRGCFFFFFFPVLLGHWDIVAVLKRVIMRRIRN